MKVTALCPQLINTNFGRNTAAALSGEDVSVDPSSPSGGNNAADELTMEGSVASVDGALSVAHVVKALFAGMERGEFLISPHQDVFKHAKRKGDDRTRWIKGMQRLNARFAPDVSEGGGTLSRASELSLGEVLSKL